MSLTTRRCARCDRNRPNRGRGLCGSCYAWARSNGHLFDYERSNRPRAEVVEEVAFLLPSRGAQGVTAALGMTPGAIARACRRAGRADLAQPFDRLTRAAP